ncbi:MAG: methyltransferase, FkbM family [Chlamydiales bacterium]|jgi:FkbM family methyltransferase|nr:methyltransferase, FkbM family [Chlamydiales bacterium]
MEVTNPKRERLLNSLGFNQLIKAKHGYLLYNIHDSYIGKSIEKYGEYSEAEVIFFKQLVTSRDIVVEVGSNIGSHTVPLAQMVGKDGRVYAFEPQRIVYQTLCANIAINSLANVEAFQIAIGANEGIATIPELSYESLSNFGGVSVNAGPNGIPVSQLKLDTILKDIPRLKLIKIDAEGMELDVLKGGTEVISNFRPLLYIENDRIEKSEALISFIMSLGYRLFWHIPYLYQKNNYTSDPENIFGYVASYNMFCIPQEHQAAIVGLTEILDPNKHPAKR